MYGQEPVLTSVRQMLDSLQDERGSVVSVEGGAGTGKTHLVNLAAGEAQLRGVSTLRITPKTPLPWRTGDGPRRPRLILVDDAHEMAAEALEEFVAPHIPHATGAVSLLLTLRDSRSRPDLSVLLDAAQPSLVRLVLRPLPPGAVSRLATDLLGAPPDDELLTWMLSAGGDPRLTRALVEGLREDGRIRVEGRLASGADRYCRPLPKRVHSAVRGLLSTVSPECRQLLYTAAVLGPRVDPELLARMLDQNTAVLLPVWEEALSSDMLRHDGDQVSFAHELLRQAVAESLPTTIRRALAGQYRELDGVGSGFPPVTPPAEPVQAGTDGEVPVADEVPDGLPVRLTARERTVLSLLTRGHSNQQIARALTISTHAVKRHVSNLLIKFDCSNRTEVALAALQLRRGNAG